MDARQMLIRKSLENSYNCVKDDARLQVPRVVPLWRQLKHVIERVRKLEDDQRTDVDTRGARAKQLKRLKTELRTVHLKRIAKRARVILHGQPGLADLLRLPDESLSTDVQLRIATRIFDAVRPHVEAFVNAGLAPDFLDRAEQVAAEIDASRAAPAEGDAVRARATAELPDTLRRGRAIIAAIDAELDVELAGQGDILAKWKHASRVGVRRGRKPKRRSAARSKSAISSGRGSARAPEVTT